VILRPRRSVGQAEHLDTLTPEDLVEGRTELGVAIPEQESGPQLAVMELPGQVPSLLHHPRSGRTVGAAGQMDATAAHLDEEQHVEPGQPDRVDDEEVDREQLVGMLTDEVAP
jgi:hypothetical protein